MLSFSYGKNLQELADSLLKELDEHPPKNLLAPEIFVVQNHGIGQWLSLYMARKEGIAANLKFEFPSERIWSLIRLVDPDIPQTLPSDRGPLTWSLMRLLQDDEVLTKLNKLHYYISDEDPIRQELRRWQLSSKIADVFDQYLVYRPELLLKWEEDKRIYHQNEAEQWQAELWRQLIGLWKEEYEGNWLHRAQLQNELLKALDEGTINKDDLPERMTVFGVSSMPPAFIQIMVKLSQLVDVHFYQLSVAPEVRDPEEFTNPMVQSLGKQAATFSAYLNRYLHENPNVPLSSREVAIENPASDSFSLFQQVKADLQKDQVAKKGLDEGDATIQVHACHSAMREVEVLYDQLLAVLDENPDMNPDDILVMTPDIETYAPMIEAVFNAPDEGQPEIPFSIADRGIAGMKPGIQSFLKILSLCQSRFKVTDVLDLLDSKPIQTAFGITDDHLNRLERWIRDNRIRWGIDGDFKQQLDVPQSPAFTWKSGLDRMILGYAMKADDDHLHNGIFPYDEIENSDDAALAGIFSRLMSTLFKLNGQVQKAKPISEWVNILSRITTDFIPDDREYFRDVSVIRNAIEQLNEYISLSGYTGDVPFRIVRSWLEEQLEEHSTGGGRIGRGVTFSSLVPMRNIPFKMIGMIGMNDGAFPRSKIPIDFDLIHLEPRPGDPARSEEDRFLFLESLLSAQSYLYFSFVGQSDRQDTDFPPSVILKEFMDYLEEYYGVTPDSLITRHRLQAFSPAYFKKNKLFSYSETQRKVAQELIEDRSASSSFMRNNLPMPDEEWKRLSVHDLVSFFQHPARYLFQNRLGIYLREEDVLTEDREPFEMNSLDNYWVGQELLDRFMKEKPLDSYQQVLESCDMLPEGWSGEQAYHQKVQEVRAFGTDISEVLNQQLLDDREVDLEVGDFRIVGKLSGIYENALLSYRFGSMRPKDLIDLWIRHLLFQLVKPNSHMGYSILFTRDKKEPFARYQLSPTGDAREILEQLLTLYWDGLQKGLYFFADSSFTFAEEVIFNGRDPGSGLNKASRKWVRDYGDYDGECADPYNKLMLGTKNPLQTEKFQHLAAQFWLPFFKVLNQEEAV